MHTKSFAAVSGAAVTVAAALGTVAPGRLCELGGKFSETFRISMALVSRWAGTFLSVALSAAAVCALMWTSSVFAGGDVYGTCSVYHSTVYHSANNCGSVGLQSATTFARQASQPGMSAVQSELRSIRDAIQNRLPRSNGMLPLGYADEASNQVLGYADSRSPASANPLYTKAPAAVAAQNYGLAVWAQGYGDYEQRWGNAGGLDIGRATTTGGFVGGIDKTFTNVAGTSGVLVVGLLGGDVTSGINNNDGSFSRLHGPSAGAYVMWVDGGFSVDSTFKADLLNLNQTTAGTVTPLDLTNYVWALNFNQKYDFKTWWVEPTAGVSDTRTIWGTTGHVLGISDGNAFRVQGGARFGTQFRWGAIPVDATLTTLLYDDVSITGGTLATIVGGQLVPTGEGLLFGQGIGKLNFDWSRDIKGLSSYVEGEVRGSTGVVGAGGKLGVRYQW